MVNFNFCLAFSFLLILMTPGRAGENDSHVDSQGRTVGLNIRIKPSVAYEDDGSNVVEITADDWNPPDVSPLFQAFRNFLFQERPPAQRSLGDEDMDLLSSTAETLTTTEASEISSFTTTADRVIDMINNNLQEAITTIAEEIEAVTLLDSLDQSTEASVASENKAEVVPLWSMFNFRSPPKRKSPENVVNITKSCSSCYVELSSCVQRCFAQYECRNIERSARECPVVAASFCNPFTPWSPVDQCQVDSDCESPLLCCNDGCVKKCSLGVWRS